MGSYRAMGPYAGRAGWRAYEITRRADKCPDKERRRAEKQSGVAWPASTVATLIGSIHHGDSGRVCNGMGPRDAVARVSRGQGPLSARVRVYVLGVEIVSRRTQPGRLRIE